MPRVGEPGHTLGGRVLPGYGFPPTEGGEPLKGISPPQPTAQTASSAPVLREEDAMARGERTYRARCVGCHKAGGGSGPNLFRTRLRPTRFFDDVATGRAGTDMPSFESILTADQIWEIYAFVVSRDHL